MLLKFLQVLTMFDAVNLETCHIFRKSFIIRMSDNIYLFVAI